MSIDDCFRMQVLTYFDEILSMMLNLIGALLLQISFQKQATLPLASILSFFQLLPLLMSQ